MKLYYHPASNNSRLPLAVAKQLGLPLELQVVDLAKGEHRTGDFLGLNPNGKVPTLQDGDFVLWESNAIAQYLCEGQSTPFYPTDRRSRAELLRWQSWSLAHLLPATSKVAYQRLWRPLMGGTPDEAIITAGLTELERFGAVLDQHLATRRYLLGDTLTLADYAVGVAFTYAAAAQLPLEGFANIRAWLARLDEDEAWRATAFRMG